MSVELRKNTSDADMLYQCLGKLCGEECEQNVTPVTDNISRCYDSPDEIEMDVQTDFSDADPDHREVCPTNNLKANRQLKSKKKSDFDFKIGIQKAKQFICEALDFGVNSGYLTFKDSKGQLLKVSSDLLHTNNPNRNDSKSNRPFDTDTCIDRRLMRKRQYNSQEKHADITKARKQQSTRKHRSRSGNVSKKRSRKSRSRSKRKQGKGRRRMGRSNSNNTELEVNPKPTKIEDIEQDDLGSNNKPINGLNEQNEDDKDECQSIESTKSNKSAVKSNNQNTTEKKNHNEDDASNYDVSEDDYNKNK